MKWSQSSSVEILVFILFVSSVAGSTIYGWGKNDNGQIGLGHNVDPVPDITAIPFYSTLSITSISIGENAHFASTGSTFYSCGSNSNGQVGQGPESANIPFFPTPTLIPTLSGNYTIFALPKATIAYSPEQKTIAGCGYAAGYVLGLAGGTYYKFQPILSTFGFAGEIETVYTANGACFVRLSDGSIYTAGVSSLGVFGLGSSSSSPLYQKMSFWDSAGVNVSKIFSTQSSSVCAQAVNKTVYCWGSNSVGQLGLGSSDDNFFLPTRVNYFDAQGYIISELKQGIMHGIALTCGGKVLTWGANQFGQLGIGSADSSSHTTPVEIEFLSDKNIVEIVSGGYHNFARTVDNQWYFWGMGSSAASGLGVSMSDYLSPTLSPRLKELGINHIASGAFSLFALGMNKTGVNTSPPSCPAGWNVNECASTKPPCGPNMDCLDTEMNYTCKCKSGYELEANDTNACQDINECLQSPCLPQAACNNTPGSYICECPYGYVGDGQANGTGCTLHKCGNGIVESGEECDPGLPGPWCCQNCILVTSGTICRNSTVPCDKAERCDGTNQYCPADDWTPGKFCDYCGNGQCNNKTETCSNCPRDCGDCAACTGILCNGKCVDSPLDCVVICQSTQFACASGICVSDFTTCPSQNCSMDVFECWDGSCAPDVSHCITIPACPLLTKRCNGRCIGSDEQCDVEIAQNCTGQVCLDGHCSGECPQFNGCPTGLIRCPSGDCASNISACKGDCPGNFYLCADKTCNLPDNCTGLLRFETAIPFSQKIAAGKNVTLGVVSTNGIPLVSLLLPNGTFQGTLSVNVSSVSFSALQQIRIPPYWNGTDLASNMYSSAVAFDVPARTKFSKNITVSFNGTMPNNMNLTDLCLGFVNASGMWDCASDLQYVNGTFIGNTSHFTPYSVIKKIHAPVFNSLSADDLKLFKNISVNSVIVYVYCGLVIVFSVLFVWAFHADREEKKQNDLLAVLKTEKYVYQEEPRTPPPARKSVPLFRPETPPTPAGVLSAAQPPSRLSSHPLLSASTSSAVSRSPSSLATSSSLSPSSVPSPSPLPSPSPSPAPSAPNTISKASGPSPSPSPSPFPDGELSVASPEKPSRRERPRTLIMKEEAQSRFTTKHKWLSIYFTARIENLPRVSRVVILLCMIMTNMTVASVFYNEANRSSTGEKIIVGIISSLISFVCSFAIFMMFKLVSKRFRAVCYTVSTIWILGTGFLTLWYNLKMEQSTAYGWCISSAIGVVQDAIINEPAKIVIISILITFCPFIPFIQKL